MKDWFSLVHSTTEVKSILLLQSVSIFYDEERCSKNTHNFEKDGKAIFCECDFFRVQGTQVHRLFLVVLKGQQMLVILENNI